jgi:hypothetical protein
MIAGDPHGDRPTSPDVDPTLRSATRRTTLRLASVPRADAQARDGVARVLTLAAILLLMAIGAWLQWAPGQHPRFAPVQWQDIAPPPTTPLHAWRWIVIHHSASRHGDSASFDHYHLVVHGWAGIGYHFLIGNGVDMPLGRIDDEFRWRLQMRGAHAGPAPEQAPYNADGIGICLVGNYEKDPIDPYQESRLVELCAQLIAHIPTLSVERIIGHRDVPGKQTLCPGRGVDIEHIRFLVRSELQRLGVPAR